MSINLSEEDGGKLLIVHVSGKLTNGDSVYFTPEFERLVRLHGKLRLLFDMDNFHGWEVNALWDTGGPLKAPVGKAILSRMFDVFGNAIDRGAALSDVQSRSVHRTPPPLARRSTKSEVFETGIKIIDVLVPLERVASLRRTVLGYDSDMLAIQLRTAFRSICSIFLGILA
jgi:hypothetical protein